MMTQSILSEFQELKLNEKVENTSEHYLKAAKAAEELILESYKETGRGPAFPIDIELVARSLGIVVVKEDLNGGNVRRLNRTLALITSQNGEGYAVIDNQVSYKTQRYALANAVGRFLLNQPKELLKCTYAIPLIPQSLEEIAADVIALFILLPITTFKNEFLKYLEEYKYCPLDVDAWMEYLGNKSQISLFNLAIGYQQMKQVLCYQRQEEFRQNDFDITKLLLDRYDRIYA